MPRAKRQVVVSLHGAIPAHGVPHDEVVEFLEDMLRQAKRGAITGIGAFWIGPAEQVIRHWVPGTASQHDMIAGAALLAFAVTKAIDEAVDV